MILERRNFLQFSLGALAAATLPLRLRAQSAGVSVIDAGGSNVVACETADGLVLVDSGAPAFANELMTQLESRGRVHTLFNTHWHADQLGANEQIGTGGAAIIAHQKTWQRVSTQLYLPHEARYVEPLPEAARPTQKFSSTGSVTIGDETIDYGALVLPHTDADIYVYFRNANVLAVGGAVTPPDIDPELDWYGGGWIGGRAQSMDMLLALANDDTLIVPATGRAMTKAELQTERDMTHELYQRLNTLIRKGCSAACMQEESALDGLGRTWRNPERFLYAAYKGLWAHHYNLAPDIL